MAKTNVRILSNTNVEGVDYTPNQIVALDAKLAKQLVDSEAADDNKDAVAYVTHELGHEVIVHKGLSAEVDSDDSTVQSAEGETNEEAENEADPVEPVQEAKKTAAPSHKKKAGR